MDVSALFTIALLHAVVLVTPGANFLLLGQLAASGQQRQAVVACLGITCVTATWATLAVWGLGAVVAMSPALHAGLPLAGGLYLLSVAVGLWRTPVGAKGPQALPTQLGTGQAFRLGFLTNILNPKTALFFTSVFGSVLPASASAWMSAAAVGVVYVNALIWHLFLALAFSRPTVQLLYGRHRQTLNRVCGALIALFALRLLSQVAP